MGEGAQKFKGGKFLYFTSIGEVITLVDCDSYVHIISAIQRDTLKNKGGSVKDNILYT